MMVDDMYFCELLEKYDIAAVNNDYKTNNIALFTLQFLGLPNAL